MRFVNLTLPLALKTSEIKFTVQLDEANVPEKIYWEATDNPNEGLEETRAIALSVWDHFHRGTLKIDLWTKGMEVGDMKRFFIETVSGMAQALYTATGDTKMRDEAEDLCRTLTRHVEEQLKQEKG